MSAVGQFNCLTCHASFGSSAELAIHEFSKKHCDNLLRASKNLPVKSKSAAPKVSAEPTAVIEPTPTVNLALYGYFDPNQPVEKPKEFNTEYDPYLQKLADNPLKPAAEVPLTNATSFATGKKKKRRSCTICNVDLPNIPAFDAHMKSAQHVWRLRVSGMGVSAHFVKAGSDLHTTEKMLLENEEKEEQEEEAAAAAAAETAHSDQVPISPSELFCQVCQLLLNSVSQYTAHLKGKSHCDNLQKKMKKTQTAELLVNTVTTGKLFCYTCSIPLTDLSQFNAHKAGKKHHTKCRLLLRQGYTIPPEERPADMPWANRPQASLKYPELYQKYLDKQNAQLMPPPPPPPPAPEPVATASQPLPNLATGMHHCSECSQSFSTHAKLQEHMKGHGAAPAPVPPNPTPVPPPNPPPEIETETGFKCSICSLHFDRQPQFEMHLNTEEHALKIAETRKTGKDSKEILALLMDDRKVIRRDGYGRYCCGICAVFSNSLAEAEQHMQSVVHKYAVKDYKKKRLIEIQQSVYAGNAGEDGSEFRCRLCDQNFSQLLLYNAHLHNSAHRNAIWKGAVGKKYYHANRWQHYMSWKNPGFRTKVGGTVKDLSSGIEEIVPNLEQIEPKIDPAKNVQVGVVEELEQGAAKKQEKKKEKKFIAPRKTPRMIYRNVPPPSRFHMHQAKGTRPPPPQQQPFQYYPRESDAHNQWHAAAAAAAPIGSPGRFHPYGARPRMIRPVPRHVLNEYYNRGFAPPPTMHHLHHHHHHPHAVPEWHQFPPPPPRW